MRISDWSSDVCSSDLVFRASSMIARLLILIARGWQLGPSRILPPTCRYAPSCSEYAIIAIGRHGAIKGGWMATKWLLRCHPWGGPGYDPVPWSDLPGQIEERRSRGGDKLTLLEAILFSGADRERGV